MNHLIEQLDQLKTDPAGAPPEAFVRAVASRYRRRVTVRVVTGACLLLAAAAVIRLTVPGSTPNTPNDARAIAIDTPKTPDASPDRPFLARGERLLRDPAPVTGRGSDRILLAHGYRNPDLEHWVRN